MFVGKQLALYLMLYVAVVVKDPVLASSEKVLRHVENSLVVCTIKFGALIGILCGGC